MNPKRNKTKELLEAIRTQNSADYVSEMIPPTPLAKIVKERAKARSSSKPAQYWLHEEDRRVIRELAAWLAGQGERPSDTLVIRAVLQTASPGPDFLNAYRQAALSDGRLKLRKLPQFDEVNEIN